MENKKISIIGAGNMGSAFYNGLKSVFSEDDLYVADHSQSKLDAIGAKNFSTNPDDIIKECDIVIFAVKPQSFNDLVSSLKTNLNYKLVISIMAGISLKQLKDVTGSSRIIRAMPNLPVKVKKGITGWIELIGMGDSDIEIAKKIFSSLGSEIQLGNESMISAMTTISGCGPAYYFLLTELLADKAKALGFSDEEAEKLIKETLIGSTELLKKDKKSARDWRYAVTSKGGVTEAVIDSLNEQNFGEIFSNAIDAGLRRDEELNG